MGTSGSSGFERRLSEWVSHPGQPPIPNAYLLPEQQHLLYEKKFQLLLKSLKITWLGGFTRPFYSHEFILAFLLIPHPYPHYLLHLEQHPKLASV